MQPTEAEFRAFIGPNATWYLQSWTKVQPKAEMQKLRWNWPAFFLNIVWLLYRRMYRYFWIGAGALVAIGMAEGMVEALLQLKAPLYLEFTINLAIACWFGSFGTWFYYRHAVETINRTRTKPADPRALSQAGGVRLMVPAILGIIVGVGALGPIAMKLRS